MEFINIRGLNWKPEAEYILKNVSVNFHEGSFYGIIGPNGSGKTSLLRHMMKRIEPEKQELQLKGQDIHDVRQRDLAREMSWVPQNTSIDVNYTAYQIVMMGRSPYLRPFQIESKGDLKLVQEAMEQTNSWQFRNKAFHTLSGGEAQRVIAARAIAQDTPIIILDEPVSHLDIRHQKELMETMRLLNKKKGKTILAVLHDLNLAARYCDKLILLDKGEIFAQGTPKEVLTCENLSKVYGLEFYCLEHQETNGFYLIPK